MDIPYTYKPRPDTGLYNAKVGIWLFLASEVMLFGALFSSYILLRVGALDGFWPDVPTAWPHGLLNIPIGTFNTAVLIISSITVVLAWTALKVGDFKKFQKCMSITLVCALGFLCIKSYEYNDKFTHYAVWLKDGTAVTGHLDIDGHSPRFWSLETVQEHKITTLKVHVDVPNQFRYPAGYKGDKAHAEGEGEEHHEREIPVGDIVKLKSFIPSTATFFAIYFTMTALHGLHVLGGALVLAYFTFFGKKFWQAQPERFTNRIEVAGLFWHFVDLVWIFLFPVMYLL